MLNLRYLSFVFVNYFINYIIGLLFSDNNFSNYYIISDILEVQKFEDRKICYIKESLIKFNFLMLFASLKSVCFIVTVLIYFFIVSFLTDIWYYSLKMYQELSTEIIRLDKNTQISID